MCFCGIPKYTRTLKSAGSPPGQDRIWDALKQDSGVATCPHHRIHNALKILLLGSTGCGKSTVIKKLRQCYGGGITLHEREQTRSMIFARIYEILACAIHQLQAEGQILGNENDEIDTFWGLNQNSTQAKNNWNEELLSAMRSLCRKAVIRVTALEILGPMNYTRTFLSAYSHTLRLDWMPTEADVVQFYVPTMKLSCTWISKDILTLEINTNHTSQQDSSELLSLADAIVCVVDIPQFVPAGGICSASVSCFIHPKYGSMGNNIEEQIYEIVKSLRGTMNSREMHKKPMQLLLNRRVVLDHESMNLKFLKSPEMVVRGEAVDSILQCFVECSGRCGELYLRQIYALSTTWMIDLIHDWRQMMLNAKLHEAGIL